MHYKIGLSSASYGFEDIWISWVWDDHGGDGEKLTESSSELKVVSVEVVNIGLSEDSVVFQFGSSDGWAVVWDQDKFGLTGSKGFDSVSVS